MLGAKYADAVVQLRRHDEVPIAPRNKGKWCADAHVCVRARVCVWMCVCERLVVFC